MEYEAKCPQCGRTVTVDYYDYQDRCESAHDSEVESTPFYCVDCNLSFNDE